MDKQHAIELGKKPIGAIAKPIISPLYLKTLQSALFTGLINEADFCKKININSQKIENYLQ